MRLITKNQNDKPAILTNQATLNALEQLSHNADPSQIRVNYYRDPYDIFDDKGVKTVESRVRDKLNDIYYNKCAYCETYCEAQIEHYRPKAGVTETPAHRGYYWLCYEWSNLIPSCNDCNRTGAKGNQFPIQGNRINSPTLLPDGRLDKNASLAQNPILSSELPYLLHPEIDNPTPFLGAAIDPQKKGICVVGLDGANQRGEKTINICKLNRTDLKLKRLTAVNEIVNSINKTFAQLIDGVITGEKFERALERVDS